MRALPTDGDVRAYGHVAHCKQRRCRDPRSSSFYRSLPLAFSWARAMGHVARDQSAQAFPVLRLPRKSKRARNGEGLGPRLEKSKKFKEPGSKKMLGKVEPSSIHPSKMLGKVEPSSIQWGKSGLPSSSRYFFTKSSQRCIHDRR